MDKASKKVDKTSYEVDRASIEARKGGRKRENLRRQTEVRFSLRREGKAFREKRGLDICLQLITSLY